MVLIYKCPECGKRSTEYRWVRAGEKLTGEPCKFAHIDEMIDPDDYVICPECGGEILVADMVATIIR